MLFYRRVEPIIDRPVFLPRDAASALVPRKIYEKIWDENTTFFRDEHIFDIHYFDFLWGIVLLQHSPPVEGKRASSSVPCVLRLSYCIT